MSRTMRAVVASAGRCVLQSVPPPVAAPGEVLITVAATALNRADTLQRKGLYPPPPNTTDVLGLECAGRVGDRRVMALLPGGGYAEQVAVPESLLMDVPPNLSLRQAAAIPETWLTAFQLLFLVANAKAGDTVLIHACGSGVGTAATQLAVRHGLKVIGTAGAEEKLARCRELGASAAFNYKAEGGFKQPVLDATDGRGVDVVLDCVGGSHAASNAGVLAMDARWVVYGLMGGAAVPSDAPILGLLLRKRAALLTSTLRSRSVEYKTELTQRFAQHALPLFASGDYTPVLDAKSFTLDDAQAAHEYLEENSSIGKVTLLVESAEVCEASG